MRGEPMRAEVLRLIRERPFRPFVLKMENGDRIPIGHPENIAFDPGDEHNGGSVDFHVVAGRLRAVGTFDAITTIVSVESESNLQIG